MDKIPSELLIIGGALLALAVVYLVSKYLKQIIIVGVVVAIILLAGALLLNTDQEPAQAEAVETSPSDEGASVLHDIADIARVFKREPQQTVQPASGGGFGVGFLTAIVALALVVAGFFYLRFRWEKRHGRRAKRRGKPVGLGANVLQELQNARLPQVIYVDLGAQDSVYDNGALWGEEWTEETELFQL